MTILISWMGRKVVYNKDVRYHGSGEATTDRFLSRKDGLVHLQHPIFEKNGLAWGLCGQRYNIYVRTGMRGVKGIPTTEPVTCMVCIALEGS